jgi:intracellular septation protein
MLNLLRAFRPIASDFLSTIVFIIAYEATASIVVGVAVGIVMAFAQIGWLKWRGRKIDLMQWASLALVVVLGSASIITRDPHFIMIKPSIGAFAIAIVMLRPNWMARYIPPFVLGHISPLLPLVWGYVWAAAIFALGVANLVVAFAWGPKFWALFTSFVPLGLQLSLFLVQYLMIRHAVVRAIRTQAAVSA